MIAEGLWNVPVQGGHFLLDFLLGPYVILLSPRMISQLCVAVRSFLDQKRMSRVGDAKVSRLVAERFTRRIALCSFLYTHISHQRQDSGAAVNGLEGVNYPSRMHHHRKLKDLIK